jgi:hypothetical protein
MEDDELRRQLERLGIAGDDDTIRIDQETGKVQREHWYGNEDTGIVIDPDTGRVQDEHWYGNVDTGVVIDPDSGKVQEEHWYGNSDTGTVVDPDTGKVQEGHWYGNTDTGVVIDPKTGRVQEEHWYGRTDYRTRTRRDPGTTVPANSSGSSTSSYESSPCDGDTDARGDLARSNHMGAILIVATLIGLGIYGLRDGHILPLETNSTTSYAPSEHTSRVELTFDPAEFSWANDNHTLLAKLLFQYGTDVIESFDRYPDLVRELRRLQPGFDPTGIGSASPSLLAKLRDGRMLFIMAGCRPHACTTYRVCIGMEVTSREVFLYQGGEQEQFFGRNDRIVRGLLHYISAGNWPTLSESEVRRRDSVAQSLRIAPETGLPRIKATVTAHIARTTKVTHSDPSTGFVTIEATADGFGTVWDGWFTIITEGSNQLDLLHKGFPDARVGDRLRITYDQNVPDNLQGPKGTAGYMSGVIVSMDVISRAR